MRRSDAEVGYVRRLAQLSLQRVDLFKLLVQLPLEFAVLVRVPLLVRIGSPLLVRFVPAPGPERWVVASRLRTVGFPLVGRVSPVALETFAHDLVRPVALPRALLFPLVRRVAFEKSETSEQTVALVTVPLDDLVCFTAAFFSLVRRVAQLGAFGFRARWHFGLAAALHTDATFPLKL